MPGRGGWADGVLPSAPIIPRVAAVSMPTMPPVPPAPALASALPAAITSSTCLIVAASTFHSFHLFLVVVQEALNVVFSAAVMLLQLFWMVSAEVFATLARSPGFAF